ncbi:MAG: hypothetical protein ACPGWM_07735, partial [Flavobacteriales bacterium]
MDIKEYIASGILENYVLGATSAQEKQEVECMSHIYPEIDLALKEIQTSIEELALAHSKTVPQTLKGKILSEISISEQMNTGDLVGDAPTTEPTKVVQLKKWKSFSAVAAVLFVLLSGYAILKSQKMTEVEDRLAQTKTELENTKSNLR